MTATLAFLFTVFTIKIIITGRTCIHYKKTNKHAKNSLDQHKVQLIGLPNLWILQLPLHSTDTFPKKLMRITWIISRLCVQRRSCRSGFCFARGRLPALLSVSSGSCGLWCFLPVVIESDQFSLMTRTQIVMLWLSCYGFLIKDVTTVTCYNHYKLLCLQKHNVKLQSFCWGESLSECGRNFCHIVSSLWWSVSVGSNRRQNKLNDIQAEHYYKQELSINMQLIYLVKLVICFLKHVAVTDAMLLQRCIILDSIWRTI